MFNKKFYENARGGGFSPLEVIGGIEVGPPGQIFVPLRRTELRGAVTGPLAALKLVQMFAYSREQCDKVLEAMYRFPLPGDAAVTGVRVRFGEVEIAATLQERAAAEAEYQEAVQQGKQAALVARESPDVFTMRVAGIQPDQDVVVETDYVQLIRPFGSEAGWLLRLPLTTAPRYVREDEVGSRYADGQPLALLRDPGHRFSLDVLICQAGDIASSTHAIDVLPEGEHDYRVRLHDEEVIPDRDLILTWTPHQEADRPSLNVWLHADPPSGQAYWMALVAPPSAHQPGSGRPREVVLLVDHSGSMSGAKWEASDWAVNNFMLGLTPQDQFALGLFHDTTQWMSKKLEPADESHVQQAIAYLTDNRDSGGTNLGVALEQALSIPRARGADMGRHVLILTDAEVSDAARILRLADQESRRPDRRRISVLCIDAAPNDFLANELAGRGGGTAHFLTSEPAEQDITTALEQVLADWAEPVLVGLRLEINRPDGQAAGRDALQTQPHAVPHTVIDLGDLPCGRAVWVVGRVPLAPGGALAFRLATPTQTIAACDLPIGGGAHPAIKALFGAHRLLGLEYLIGAGYNPDMLREQLARLGFDPQTILEKPSSVYHENATQDAQSALKSLLVRESLQYGIACSETAFVAVRSEAGEKVQSSIVVANALPSGWSDSFASPGAGVTMGAMLPVSMAMPMGMPAPPSPSPLMRMAASSAINAYMAADTDDALVAGAPAPVATKQAGGRLKRSRRDKAPEPEAAESAVPAPLFSGVPVWVHQQAVLFDSTIEERLPLQGTLSRLQVRWAGAPPAAPIDRGLMLLIFVGDMALPCAQVRLADLLRSGGSRPLNLLRRAGQAVRVVLTDPNGAWAANLPELVMDLSM